MRRRDLLKVGLVVAAIPVGAKMMWEKCMTREDRIRRKVHDRLKDMMCHREGALNIIGAYEFVDDVLDLTFSLVTGKMSPESVDDAPAYVKCIQQFVRFYGGSELTEIEISHIVASVHMVRINYAHQVSEGSLGVLLSVAVSAKYFQMREDIPME